MGIGESFGGRLGAGFGAASAPPPPPPARLRASPPPSDPGGTMLANGFSRESLLAERNGFAKDVGSYPVGGYASALEWPEIVVSTVAQLKTALETTTPRWITVAPGTGRLTPKTAILLQPNFVLDGRGWADGLIGGVPGDAATGLIWSGYERDSFAVNAILAHVKVRGFTIATHDDALQWSYGAHLLWAHHCEFGDDTDGAFDVTLAAKRIRVAQPAQDQTLFTAKNWAGTADMPHGLVSREPVRFGRYWNQVASNVIATPFAVRTTYYVEVVSATTFRLHPTWDLGAPIAADGATAGGGNVFIGCGRPNRVTIDHCRIIYQPGECVRAKQAAAGGQEAANIDAESGKTMLIGNDAAGSSDVNEPNDLPPFEWCISITAHHNEWAYYDYRGPYLEAGRWHSYNEYRHHWGQTAGNGAGMQVTNYTAMRSEHCIWQAALAGDAHPYGDAPTFAAGSTDGLARPGAGGANPGVTRIRVSGAELRNGVTLDVNPRRTVADWDRSDFPQTTISVVDTADDRPTPAPPRDLPGGRTVEFVTSGTLPAPLLPANGTDARTYYWKRVGHGACEIYSDFALTQKIDLTSAGSGTHSIRKAMFRPSDYYDYTLDDTATLVETLTGGDASQRAGKTL